MAELLEAAGDDVDERWVTGALLADFEAEVQKIEPRAKAPQTYSATSDAARDEADGASGALLGVGLAVVAIVAQQLLSASSGGGGGGGGLEGFPTI